MDSCAFCGIIRGEDAEAVIVWEDERTMAFAPLKPATVGHTLVVPKAHVARLWNLGEDDGAAVMRATVMLSGAIRRTLHPEGMNIIQSNGTAATQTVDHVHIHLVPRWGSDRMTLRWPRMGAQSRAKQQMTASLVSDAMEQSRVTSLASMSPEDRRQHLSFVQSVISRMASASASAKTWLLPIVTAAYGYGFVQASWPVALFGLAAVAVFALLDANYLKQERSFRNLYDSVAQGKKVPAFSMNPTVAGPSGSGKVNYWPDSKDWLSWAIAPFYIPLLTVGAALITYIILTG